MDKGDNRFYRESDEDKMQDPTLPAEPINELAGALAAAQGEMSNAAMNKINPHFKSKYADLGSIRDATVPALSKHGLALVQYTTFDQGVFVLKTRLCHKSGQWMESEYPLPHATDKPQVMGSALTYARRYSWSAMCGIASEDDDDAEAAQNAKAKAKAPARTAAADRSADPGPQGPDKTKLRKEAQAFASDVQACEDMTSLIAFANAPQTIAFQDRCIAQWPECWYGEEGTDKRGLAALYDDRKALLQEQEEDLMRAG